MAVPSYICAMGVHDCLANVNNGYCATGTGACQFAVLESAPAAAKSEVVPDTQATNSASTPCPKCTQYLLGGASCASCCWNYADHFTRGRRYGFVK